MEKLRVTWVQHGGEYGWLPVIGEHLKAVGIETTYVCTLEEGHSAYLRAGCPSAFISPAAFDESIFVTDSELAELDARYGSPTMKAIVNSDVHMRHLFGTDEARQLRVVARAYWFWERYFQEHDPDYVFVRETASFATRTVMNVANRLGRPKVVRPDIGPSDRYVTFNDIGEQLVGTAFTRQMNVPLAPLTAERRMAVDELVAERIRPASTRNARLERAVDLSSGMVELFRSWRHERSVEFARDPIGVAAERQRRRFLKQRMKAKILLRTFGYADPVDEPCVYFPLFFTEEGTNLGLFHFWSRNIVALAIEIAESLPVGFRLWVKEHPAVPGDISYRDLRRLRAHPRIRVLDPRWPGQDIIRRTSLLIAVQGTVAWEAFLLRKPLVILSGKPFYAYAPRVVQVGDISELGSQIARVLGQPSQFVPREDEWYSFIDRSISSSSGGSFTGYEPPFFSASPVNLAALSDSIIAYVRDDQQRLETKRSD